MYPRYQDLSQAELALLTEANLYEFLATLGRHAEAEIAHTPDLTRYSDSAIISPMFNGVISPLHSLGRFLVSVTDEANGPPPSFAG